MGGAVGVGLFSLGIPFIYFSSQVKPYSSDVAAALFLTLAALEVRRRGVNARRALAGHAWRCRRVVFPARAVRHGRHRRGLLILVVGSEIVRPSDRSQSRGRSGRSAPPRWPRARSGACQNSIASIFRWFWADGFMPMPPGSVAEFFWVPWKLTWVFGKFELGLGRTDGGLSYRWSPVFAVVMAWGFWALWQKHRDAALFHVASSRHLHRPVRRVGLSVHRACHCVPDCRLCSSRRPRERVIF